MWMAVSHKCRPPIGANHFSNSCGAIGYISFFDVGGTDFRRRAFHWKPERVAETLPDEAAAKLV